MLTLSASGSQLGRMACVEGTTHSLHLSLPCRRSVIEYCCPSQLYAIAGDVKTSSGNNTEKMLKPFKYSDTIIALDGRSACLDFAAMHTGAEVGCAGRCRPLHGCCAARVSVTMFAA